MGREIGRDRTDLGEQAGECPAVALGGDPRRAAGIQPGESDVAAQVSRHAASGAVVMEDRRAIPGTLADGDIGRITGTGGAFVGRAAAGLNHHGPGDGGAP